MKKTKKRRKLKSGYYEKYVKGKRATMKIPISDYLRLKWLSKKMGLSMTGYLSELLLSQYQKARRQK